MTAELNYYSLKLTVIFVLRIIFQIFVVIFVLGHETITDDIKFIITQA